MFFRRARPRLLGGFWGLLIKIGLVLLCLRFVLAALGALFALAMGLIMSIVIGALLWTLLRYGASQWRQRRANRAHSGPAPAWRDPAPSHTEHTTPAEPWASAPWRDTAPPWETEDGAAARPTLPVWLDRLGGWLLGHPWGTTWTEARARVAWGGPDTTSAYHPQERMPRTLSRPRPLQTGRQGRPTTTGRPSALPELSRSETAQIIDALIAESRPAR